jgi:hypothetical protein
LFRREDLALYFYCISWKGGGSRTEGMKEHFNVEAELSFFHASRKCPLRMKSEIESCISLSTSTA